MSSAAWADDSVGQQFPVADTGGVTVFLGDYSAPRQSPTP